MTKIGAAIRSIWTRFKTASFEEKVRLFLLAAIYGSTFLTLLTICLLSGHDRFHLVPLALAGLQATLMLAYLLFYKKFFLDVPTLFLAAFPFYSAICSLWGFRDSGIITQFLLAALAIVMYQFTVGTHSQHRMLVVWELALLAFSLFFFGFYFGDIINMRIDRLGAAFNNINIIATFFASGFCISLYFVLKKRFLVLIPMLLFLGLGFLTGSKQFLFGIFPPIVVFVFFLFGKKKWYFALLTLGLAAVFLIALLQIPAFATIKLRLEDFFAFLTRSDSGDGSSSERLAMMIEALHMFGQSPLFGNGHGAFVHLSYFSTYAHNTVANVAADYGLVGLVLFFAPLVVLIRESIRASMDKNNRAAALAMALMLVVLSVVRVFTEDKSYYITLALALSFTRANSALENYALLSIRFKKRKLSMRRFGAYADGSRHELLPNDCYRI